MVLELIPETCLLHDFEIQKLFKIFRSKNDPNSIDNNDNDKLFLIDSSSDMKIIMEEEEKKAPANEIENQNKVLNSK